MSLLLLLTRPPIQLTTPISGLSITRRLDGPLTFKFMIDNYDGARGGITKDDTLALKLRDTDGNLLQFRGQVQTLGVGLLCEVVCADISAQWDRWKVTRTLQRCTLGQAITAIVENPTGNRSSGVIAQVEEIDDPLVPGQPVMLDYFNGAGKALSAWLSDFQTMTGARWYLEWNGTAWIFHWFLPSSRPDWGVTLRDDINADQETASAARVLKIPEVTIERKRANRVRYRMSYSPPVPPPGYATMDAYFTEGAAGWAAHAGCSVADENTIKVAGAKSTRLRYYSTVDKTILRTPLLMGYFLLPQQYRDMRGPDIMNLRLQARLSVLKDGAEIVQNLQPQLATVLWFDGATPGPWIRGGSAAQYCSLSAIAQSGWGSSIGGIPKGEQPWTDYLDNVTALSFGVSFSARDVQTATTSLEILLYLDAFEFVPNAFLDQFVANEKVETAAVTAGTEYPLEVEVSDQAIPRSFGALLANTMLANLSRSKTTVGALALAGMRNVPLEKNVPLQLASVGISGVSYPIVEVNWATLETGDTTTLTLGDAPSDDLRAFEVLVNRIRSLDSQRKAA